MKFSEKKFCNLSDKRKIKKIIDFMKEMDINWVNPDRGSKLRDFLEIVHFNYSDVNEDFEFVIDELSKITVDSSHRDFVNILTAFETRFGRDVRDMDFVVIKGDVNRYGRDDRERRYWERGLPSPQFATNFPGKGHPQVKGYTCDSKDLINSSRNSLLREEYSKKRNLESKLGITVVLDNLRSAFNVGSIFRTSDCLRINKLILCGVTASPKNKKVKATAMGSDEFVDWEYFKSTEDAIKKLKKDGLKIYALETVDVATDYTQVEYPNHCALILGNEALGISEKSLKLADSFIKIPVYGFKNSLNVGVAFAIVGYRISERLKVENDE